MRWYILGILKNFFMLFNFDVMNTYDFSILKIYFFLNMIIDKWEINLFIKILLIIVIKY